MGMIVSLLRVTRSKLDKFLEDSSLLEAIIYNEDDAPNPKLTDIDKSWDGIIFLLTGHGIATANATDHPFLKILFSGQTVDDEQDLGYGPAHYVTPEQVVEWNEKLSGITVEQLKNNYNPTKMTEAEVYPSIWDEGDDAFEYLTDYFKDLQQVYATAAKNGEAVITFLN